MPDLDRRLRLQPAPYAVDDDSGNAALRLGDDFGSTRPDHEALEFLREALPAYEFLGCVHSGGQGMVYEARHRATQRRVAIKILLDGPLASERHRRRFEQEAEILSRLRHPNIVGLYDSGIVRGRHYLAMEFVQGLAVDHFILLNDLSVSAILDLFIMICRAVHHAHLFGVIHRDLKPANLLVDDDGVPRICDFGLAAAESAYKARAYAERISSPGQVVGTLPYASPEQLGGDTREVDARTDVYSLGVVLFELLTDSLPYPMSADSVRMHSAILNEPPRRLRSALSEPHDLARRGFLRDLETILLKALAKDKTRRYQSAAALADDLQHCLRGEAVTARADSQWYVFRKTLRRHRLPLGVAATFVLVLMASLVTVAWMWTHARHDRDNATAVAGFAHDALNRTITKVDESVTPLAGGVRVRDAILSALGDDLLRLRPLVERDANMDGVSATLHEKLGDIAFTQAKRGDAETQYREFVRLAALRSGQHPADHRLLVDVARSYRKLARVVGDADTLFKRALATCEQVLLVAPNLSEAQIEACTTMLERARVQLRQGRRVASVDSAQQAVSLAREQLRVRPDDAFWNSSLAEALQCASESLPLLGRANEALAALTESVAIRRRLSHADPANADLRYRLMLSLGTLGCRLRDAGDNDQALATLLDSLEHGEYLVTVDPSVEAWKRDACSMGQRVVRQYLLMGRAEDARRVLNTISEYSDDLLRSSPQRGDLMRIAAFQHLYSAQVSSKFAEVEKAVAEAAASVGLWSRACQQAPDNDDFLAEQAAGYDYLGQFLAQMGFRAESLNAYESSYHIRSALLQRSPSLVARRTDYALSEMKLATGHLRIRTAVDDQIASFALDRAERVLQDMLSSGALGGQSAAYRGWIDDICTNRTIVQNRQLQSREKHTN